MVRGPGASTPRAGRRSCVDVEHLVVAGVVTAMTWWWHDRGYATRASASRCEFSLFRCSHQHADHDRLIPASSHAADARLQNPCRLVIHTLVTMPLRWIIRPTSRSSPPTSQERALDGGTASGLLQYGCGWGRVWWRAGHKSHAVRDEVVWRRCQHEAAPPRCPVIAGHERQGTGTR